MKAKRSRASKRPSRKTAPARVVVENVNTPGKSRALDAANYNGMRRALLKVLPRRSPGLNYAEMSRAVRPHLSEKVSPAAPEPAGG